uniref:Microsomal signal peptidase 12 kDa subunit n=1 Tax=Nymphaea colorata TaxID=210225 RepID=A0A5K1FRW4_9MAGN
MGREGGAEDGHQAWSAEKVLRYSLFSLAAVVCGVGLYTLSLKKMVVVYLSGLLLIAGVVLPDWEFFERDVSHWTSPRAATQPALRLRSFRSLRSLSPSFTFLCQPERIWNLGYSMIEEISGKY